MNAQPPLTWENFRASVFVLGQQRVHRMANAPLIEIFGDAIQNRVGMWLQVPPNIPLPESVLRLEFIRAQIVTRHGIKLLELVVNCPALFRNFYHFSVAVSERILVDRMAPVDAVSLELHGFAELLEERPLLGIERQLGLIGELIVLDRLVKKNGLDAIDAWIGPRLEPHDFRIGTAEFEVKTTIRSQRIHTIHGTEQLMPSHGFDLFLMSILLGPAGASPGVSLGGLVDSLTTLFTRSAARLTQFTDALATSGFHYPDKPHYLRSFVLRRPLALVPTAGTIPAITKAQLKSAFGGEAARLDAVSYDLNVEGLEIEDTTPGFAAVFDA